MALSGEATLFNGAMWLFTPTDVEKTAIDKEWRGWVGCFGSRTLDMDPARHDELCAWVSHLPQMLSTALAALLEDRFGDAPEVAAIGGRALSETTRLGASPYSMWRDVALTNTGPIADTLLALEQRLTMCGRICARRSCAMSLRSRTDFGSDVKCWRFAWKNG